MKISFAFIKIKYDITFHDNLNYYQNLLQRPHPDTGLTGLTQGDGRNKAFYAMPQHTHTTYTACKFAGDCTGL